MSSGDPDRGPDSAAETSAAPPEKLRTPSAAVPGTLLAGRYRIISPLGKGGMGEVYRADDIRLGQLSSTVFLFTLYVLVRTPLTLDWSAWYAGRSFAVLGFFAALLLIAFYTSLGGKPLFGKALLED